jgi:hypothetical protein
MFDTLTAIAAHMPTPRVSSGRDLADAPVPSPEISAAIPV